MTLDAALSTSKERCMYYHLPTGTGKTRVAAALLGELLRYGRVLFVAHRQELIHQAARSLQQDLPTASVGIVMGNDNNWNCDVVVASIQTLDRGRMDTLLQNNRLTKHRIVACLVDECHHATASNAYAEIVQKLHAQFPRAAIIGCTATPYRADKMSMQAVFPLCTFTRSIKEMQAAGVLAPVTWRPVHVDFEQSTLKTSSIGGEKDFSAQAIEEGLSPHLAEIVEKTAPLLQSRPTVVFAATVKHAQELAEFYNLWYEKKYTPLAFMAPSTHYPFAAAIWGEMQRQDRDDFLHLWKLGKIQVVVNVGILTEGFDYQPESPNKEGLAAMVIARPTMSPGLYMQMLGRGTRLKPGSYKDCLVIDIAGNANLIESKQLVLPKVLDEPVEEAIYDILENPALLDFPGNALAGNVADHEMGDEEKQREKKKKPIKLKNTDPLARSWVSWGLQDGIYYTNLMNGCFLVLREATNGSGLYKGTLLTQDRNTRVWSFQGLTESALPLHELMQHANLVVAQTGTKKVLDKSANWRGEPATEKALLALAKWDAPKAKQARYENWSKGEVGLAFTWAILKGQLRRCEA